MVKLMQPSVLSGETPCTKEFPNFMTSTLSILLWQILRYFLDFKTNKNFSYIFRIRKKDVKKYFIKISVAPQKV